MATKCYTIQCKIVEFQHLMQSMAFGCPELACIMFYTEKEKEALMKNEFL